MKSTDPAARASACTAIGGSKDVYREKMMKSEDNVDDENNNIVTTNGTNRK